MHSVGLAAFVSIIWASSGQAQSSSPVSHGGNVAWAMAAPLTRARALASTEVFGWMVRHPEHPLAKLLARPGHELQVRFATAEPTPAQVEVAQTALEACLELERGNESPD